MVTKHNIWQCRQNKPSLLALDLTRTSPTFNAIMEKLLEHGVFKWFSVRRDVIKVKDEIKRQIKEIQEYRKKNGLNGYDEKRFNVATKDNPVYVLSINDMKKLLASVESKSTIKILEAFRKDIRALCHSDRWRAPDNDLMAQFWLSFQEEGKTFDLRVWEKDQ